MRIMWVQTSHCYKHSRDPCDCHKTHKWLMFCDGVNSGAAIQQFLGGFYGTWEVGGGGRTGCVASLEGCKQLVEEAVIRVERPN